MNHRHLVVALAASPVLALAGCSSGEAIETSKPETTTHPQTTEAPPPTTYRRGELTGQDRVFFSLLDDYWRVGRDADVIEVGEFACEQLNDGTPKTEVLQFFVGGEQNDDGDLTVDTGEDFENSVNLLHSAITAYCPEHLTGVR
ncbi:DUF732 domain-containing protein [Dietzia natronolimnaea]|uniref:DUF732 domain-containing protein n=1 Tax=Dietzia natronolimnaea TaxID=161920 RepID=UPI003D12000E